MGGVVSDLFGGSNSSAQQSSVTNGFGGLPQQIQSAFTNLASSGSNLLSPNGTPNSSINTLPALNPSSTNALGQIENQNFAITPQSIQSGISEQMNPYDSSVIGQIENAQNGSLSQLNQYLTNSGTYGSNRGMLGASDISNVAANQVGGFLNNEYNTALNNSLTTIPSVNAQSAAGSVQAGQTAQSQAFQNQQAPITSLAQLAQIMGVLPQNSNSGSSDGTSDMSSNNGIFKSIGI